MTKQAGVKTIAVGGRSNREKIQAIGGVKGVNNYGWNYIQAAAENAIGIADAELQAKLANSVLKTGLIDNMIVFSRASGGAGVNVRDGIAQNDTTGTALQFVYEEADCRLYYTPEMTIDASAIWKAAASAQWGQSGKCVGGSGGYGADSKRANDDVVHTMKLNAGRVKVAHALALQKMEEFEKSFELQTECTVERNGFMKP
jgi:hypothetical protein